MSQHCKTIIEDLYPLNRCLLGEGYDTALKYIDHLIPLEVLEFPTGTQVGTWTVPEEWVVRDAWVKKDGVKIIDYQKNPLSLVVGSLPFSGTVSKEVFQEHCHYSDICKNAHLYEYMFYDRDWGVTYPKNLVYGEKVVENAEGKIGLEKIDLLEEGDYEVFIDTEYRNGTMKVGVHTILGKTDREILLLAHLDHPFQANDNLSGVAALIDLVTSIKPFQYNHTIKLIFCPETIGSIAYASTQDISKVDFVIALDAVGNENEEGILLQKAFDKDARINNVAHLALRGLGTGYRQGIFRSQIGSDEYVFNDPKYGIPGIMFSTHPYPEYHTSEDTPEKINYEVIEKVQKLIIKTIEYYEQDFIPERNFEAPLFRSKYGIQTKGKGLNLSWDYFIYSIDGEKYFSQLCCDFGLNYEYVREHVDKLITDKKISSWPIDSKRNIKKTPRKKHARVQGKTDAPAQSGEVS
jgi:aminopeptidase-like protein